MEERTKLISYKVEADLVNFTINPDDEEYCEVLTKLFNNKREEKEIVDLYNNYANNKITIVVNLTEYVEDFENKEDAINHIKEWLVSFTLNGKVEDVEVYEHKGSIYYIDEFESDIPYEKDGEYLDRYYFNSNY